MEIMSFIADVGTPLLRIFGVICVIMVIIFVHEMGHYLVGRWCGIGASAFSLGFGPEICSRTDKRGTRWRIALIPLGGYVKFIGDEDAAGMASKADAAALPGSFASAGAWARAATVFAGPFTNALFTVVVLSFFFFSYGRIIIEPVIGSLVDGAPAMTAGLKPGDRFIEMDGQKVESFDDLIGYVSLHGGDPIDFTLERSGQPYNVTITPKPTERDDGFGNKVRVGMIGAGAPADPNNPGRLDPAYEKHVNYGLFSAIGEATDKSAFIVVQTVRFLGRLIEGREDRCQLSGPSKTATIAWQVSETGFMSLLNLTAFLSIGIGLINLFPLPPLDGGHLVFYVIEGVIGRPVPKRIQEIIFSVGFIIVVAFMLFAISNDYLCWLG
ncbi:MULTISPECIES: RIP metalloprotease RseP [Bartonella]|uniref:RIP metalloprotease RseP n=1 Tax=Bartonella TaxID=773 RepID=UPI0018DE4B82|nr:MULTISPECIES: RIP metalloprotease RseP [Bartonella]MBH9994575.1 RIP metalloprotease RseP [Bartonella sp. P0291]MBH9997080.1 RIP metalloprotease RseP [Bartonella sp. M0192]MBH9999240.1 RIP metalloprotease RseP [Bartonella sp. M0191]MBI0007279.1 RIP metalloprotease RseP [Bartonella sp. M0193]MBI0010531.1 RIP metalloprotease RseP [Bartonella sp. M0176]